MRRRCAITDQSPRQPDEEAVRRLLAEARHDQPMPPEVVARLDERLVALQAERASQAVADVVPLASRRRRVLAGLVAAAAFIVVGGVALGQVLPSQQGEDSMSAGSADSKEVAPEARPSADSELGAGASSGGAESDELKGAPEAPTSTSSKSQSQYLDSDRAVLTSGPSLRKQVIQLRSDGTYALAQREESETENGFEACVPPEVRSGESVRFAEILLDGSPGVVVYTPLDGSRELARVWVCGATTPLHRFVLPRS